MATATATDTQSKPLTMLQELRALPRPVWILFVGTFVNKFGTFVMPFLALYLTKNGYTKGETGLALGAYGVGHFVAAALGGYLADLIGRRKTITLSMALAAVAMMLLPFADSLLTVTLAAFFAGMTADLYRPAASALLADLVPPENRLTAFAAYRFAFNAGWALGPATAGLLAQYDYLWLFVGESITCAVFGVVAWFALPKGVRSEKQESGWGVALRQILKDRGYLLLISSYLGIGFVLFQMMTTLGVYVDQLGFTEADYGKLLSINGVMIVFIELPLVSLTRRLPAGIAIATGFLLMAAAMVVQAHAFGIPMLIAATVLMTFGEMTAFPIAMNYIASRAPADMRGRYMGMVGFVWSTSLIIAPWSGMRLLAWNPAALWWVCAIAAGGAALLVARIHTLPVPAREKGNTNS